MKYIILFLSLFLFSCSNIENNNISNEAKKEETIQKTILSLWDSITAGYLVWENENYPYKLQELLQKNRYNYKIVNGWVSWNTSDDLLSRVDLYLDLNPDILILVIWWNDWLRWLSTQNLKQNILDIISKFDKNKTKIILSWMDIPLNLWEKYRSDFKQVYKDISSENKDIYFQDFFLQDVAGIESLNNSDKIHPNSKWYDIVVKNLYDFMIKNNLLK